MAPSNIRHDAYGGRIDAEAEFSDGSDLRTRLLDHRVVVDHDGRTRARRSAARRNRVCRTGRSQAVKPTGGEVAKPKHAVEVRQRRRIVRRYGSK